MEFYGRKDILDLLDKRAEAFSKGYRQNIAIIGEELIGKTCLIRHWLSRYCNNYLVFIYLELKLQEMSSFVQKFSGAFLTSFLRNSQIDLTDDLDFLLDKGVRYIPQTAAFIKEILLEARKKKGAGQFSRVLQIPEYFYRETNKRCVIIFDEFQFLEGLRVSDDNSNKWQLELYEEWRKQIMLDKNTMYILLSSKIQLAGRILSDNLNLLFGNFEKIEISAFDTRTAKIFLRDKLLNLKPQDTLTDFIISFTSARPFYLNVLSEAFGGYHAKYPNLSPSVDSLVSSLEHIFLDNWGVLNRRFTCLLSELEGKLKNQMVSKVLVSAAYGANSILEIAHRLQKTKSQTVSLIGEAVNSGLLSRSLEVYLLEDKIFSFWLRCIYDKKLRAFESNMDNFKAVFQKGLKELYKSFEDAQAQGISRRLLELFSQFNNEAIEVEKKHLRLNQFKEVKLLNMNGRQIKEGILARGVNSLWIAGIKEDNASEEDIIEFAELCKRFKYDRVPRKIFIAFEEIDANASLIAKEEKIYTWDISFVNLLLDIYGKPRIIR